MSFFEFLEKSTDIITLAISLFILLGGIILSFKTRFVQIRAIPLMIKLLFKSLFEKTEKNKTEKTIPAHRALFTAMATSIGLGNIASPVIAIKMGGPGALIGFMLAAIFGSATTFTEVTCALKFRKKNPDGSVSGGPMQYIKEGLSPTFALIYAYAGFLMLTAWSGFQTNQFAEILKPAGIPTYISGIFLAITITYILVRGIKTIGTIATAKVPLMFILYCGSTSWIIFKNWDKLPSVFSLIFKSAFTPQALAGAAVGYGLMQALRWGLPMGFFANESGLGTATIPHSMSETQNPVNQGIISMVAVYSNGFVCLLSGLVVLVTETWKISDPTLGVGINLIAKAFSMYFPTIGIPVLIFSAFLFAFGTTMGNSFNGSQCFLYATKNRGIIYYQILVAIVIFASSIMNIKTLATFMNLFYVPIAIPNILAIINLAFKRKGLLEIHQEKILLDSIKK
jgi:alanine or glycine:cation symporter, AGCS family